MAWMAETTAWEGMMEFVTLFCDAVIIASGRVIARHVGGVDKIDCEILSTVVRQAVKGNLDKLMAEWEQATEAIVSNATLRAYVEAQALELADEVVDAYYNEVVWAS